MKNIIAKTLLGIHKSIVPGLLFVTVLAVFVPLTPIMPGSGLDESWVYAMNEAVAKDLVFGKDIIFSFGPYASIYTKSYHPETDRLMVFGSIYLGVCYGLVLLLLSKATPLKWPIALGVILAGLMLSRDVLLLSYPLLLAMVVYRLNLPLDHEKNIPSTRSTPIFAALLLSPFGLLPLIKGSMLLIAVVIVALFVWEFLNRENKVLAAVSVLSPLASLIVFWLSSGQPLTGLPYFLFNLTPIISGYTEAMATHGRIHEIVVFIIASVSILYITLSIKSVPITSRLFLLFAVAVYLFITFKGGFVRHDGHAVMAGIGILMVAVLLPFVLQHKYLGAALSLSVLACVTIDKNYVGSSTRSVIENIENTFSSAYAGIETRLSTENTFRDAFNERVSILNKEASIPLLSGTTDIYSYNQSYLIASGNNWLPRPILQSYSAYTPRLAQLNKAHLLDERAPDNVIFKLEPIDGRLPSLEDGLSWPVLLHNYSPFKLDKDFIYLHKNKSHNTLPIRKEIYNKTHQLGEDVYIPTTSDQLFAEIDIRQTLLGRLASVLFKTSQLEIHIALQNGDEKKYRIVANMVRSGFLISPLIENSTDFILQYGNRGYLLDKLVKSIRVSSISKYPVFWNALYSLKLSNIKFEETSDVGNLIKFDAIQESIPSGTTKPEVQVACDGSIDVLNGISPVPSVIRASNILSLNGWQAISAKDGIVPDAVFVTLTNTQGEKVYIRTRTTPRVDVKKHFSQPAMPDVGYTAFADISRLKGDYILGLSRMHKGRLETCEQFNITIKLHGKKVTKR